MKLIVLGAGRQGSTVAFDLLRNPAIEAVGLADVDRERLEAVRKRLDDRRLALHTLDVRSTGDLVEQIGAYDACLAAVPGEYHNEIARAAIAARTHYCDLGAGPAMLAEQLQLDTAAFEAGVAIVPDCGLAPGLVTILAAHAIRRLDEITSVQIRVGTLPQEPQPPLHYARSDPLEHLILRYVERAIVIRDGVKVSIEPLTEVETIEFSEPYGTLEAFHTSGGLSTLPNTFAGRVRNMDYKTIRRPGHCALMQPLARLGFFDTTPLRVGGTEVSRREFTTRVLEEFVRPGVPDVVLARVIVVGTKFGARRRIEYQLVDLADAQAQHSALMRCTAFSASIVLQMLASGRAGRHGVVPQERWVNGEEFIAALRERGLSIVEGQS
jgi:lysine 6-dehydrogenase